MALNHDLKMSNVEY